MINDNQKGFSLIELILVVAIISVVAAIAIPSLTKAVSAGENGAAIASLKTVFLAQTAIYTQKNRYGRLDEVNTYQNGNFGTTVPPNTVIRGKYTYEMIPAQPTDIELKSSFKIKATRIADSASNVPFVLEMDQTGQVTQITP